MNISTNKSINKLSADFLSRTKNTQILTTCTSLSDYINALAFMVETNEHSAFKNEFDFYNSAINMLAEFYLKYFENEYNFIIQSNFNVSDKTDKYTQLLYGTDSTNKMLCKAVFRKHDDIITMNNGHLAGLYNEAIKHGVCNGMDNSIFYFCPTNEVHESVISDMPANNMFKFILKNEIENHIDQNNYFWTEFKNAINSSLIVKKSHSPIALRDYQNEAVCSMMNNRKGRVLLPTGTGKSVIMAEYIVKYVADNRNSPIIVIMAPRIILTYYLMANVFKQAIAEGITNIEFINVSSGNMIEEARDMREILISNGVERVSDVTSTTCASELKRKYDEAKGRNNPLVIVSTYHSCSIIKDALNDIDVICCDEAHNLVVGDAPIESKEIARRMNAKNKFFFTATQRTTSSNDGIGMNNEEIFGKIIFNKSYKTMTEKMEIVPIQLSLVEIHEQIIKGINPIDNERDATVKIESICASFLAHKKDIKSTSVKPELIEPKLLVTVNDSATLAAIIRSDRFNQLISSGIDIFSISTNTSFVKNNTTYDGSNFKELFMKEMKLLGDSNRPAIILHVDMLSEGLDVPGITGVMFFDELNLVKMLQLFGRSMRLHPIDRKGIYDGSITRHQQMIKPMAQVILPMYMSNSNDMRATAIKNLELMFKEYDYIPEQRTTTINTIGDIQNFNNDSFKAKELTYDKLSFEHHIAFNGLFHISSLKSVKDIFEI